MGYMTGGPIFYHPSLLTTIVAFASQVVLVGSIRSLRIPMRMCFGLGKSVPMKGRGFSRKKFFSMLASLFSMGGVLCFGVVFLPD